MGTSYSKHPQTRSTKSEARNKALKDAPLRGGTTVFRVADDFFFRIACFEFLISSFGFP
jgi:hypothetical protein